eukprot:4169129-Prymnesium_polylepis.1
MATQHRMGGPNMATQHRMEVSLVWRYALVAGVVERVGGGVDAREGGDAVGAVVARVCELLDRARLRGVAGEAEL